MAGQCGVRGGDCVTEPRLDGVWCYPSAMVAGETDIMCIDESRSRMITFVHVEPGKRASTRHWTRAESPTSVAMRLRHDSEWTVHEFKFRKGSLVWFYGDGVHPWKALKPARYPDWLPEALAAAHQKMDEEEQRSQARAAGK